MSDILNKTIVLVLNRNWQAINVRTPHLFGSPHGRQASCPRGIHTTGQVTGFISTSVEAGECSS